MKGLFLVLSLALASGLLAQERRPTRVSISSQPSGATVVIDGVSHGTTPITLFDLKPGRHHLKCRLDGYEENDSFFSTSEGPVVERVVTLEEVKGLLLLKTDPAGCDIQVDGVSVGLTPQLLTGLSASGTYAVRLRKAGYQDQLISVRFDGRKPLVRDEKMVLSSGAIDIRTEPSGAEVSVNGIVRGASPLKVTEIPKGRATVKFHLDGFEDETRELSISAGDQQTLAIALKGLPGTLHLVSDPEGARFYVSEEARGKGPLTITGLHPGEYEVRAEKEGFGTLTKTIRIGNGAAVREEFKLSNVMGRLELRSSPPGAQVLLDGHIVGKTSSKDPTAEFSDIFAIENVMEGEHTVTLRMDGYADYVRHPKVQNQKTAKHHKMRLQRIFKPDIELVTSRGTYTGVFKANRAGTIEVEVKPGITSTFQQDEIRNIRYLKEAK